MGLIFDQKRQEMVQRLRSKGIRDERVLKAMSVVPRERFVAAGLEMQAYDEKALPIGFGQTISHPYTVAVMTQALGLNGRERILEIGTGSGYQAAVLCEMGARVFTIEKITPLAQFAQQRLKAVGYHFMMRIGDGTIGWQNYAPFDGVIITAGAPVVPENMQNQLADGGRLVVPIGHKERQVLTLYLKESADSFKKIEIENLKFVPLLGRKGW